MFSFCLNHLQKAAGTLKNKVCLESVAILDTNAFMHFNFIIEFNRKTRIKYLTFLGGGKNLIK
jgi:hypothetical protein